MSSCSADAWHAWALAPTQSIAVRLTSLNVTSLELYIHEHIVRSKFFLDGLYQRELYLTAIFAFVAGHLHRYARNGSSPSSELGDVAPVFFVAPSSAAWLRSQLHLRLPLSLAAR